MFGTAAVLAAHPDGFDLTILEMNREALPPPPLKKQKKCHEEPLLVTLNVRQTEMPAVKRDQRTGGPEDKRQQHQQKSHEQLSEWLRLKKSIVRQRLYGPRCGAAAAPTQTFTR